jgi:hypothetical protein
MKRNYWQTMFALLIVLITSSAVFADRKIRQKIIMQGQTMESTVMIKGSRQRTETMMGGDAGKYMPRVATVMQCDLKRNLLINDTRKLYFFDPFADTTDVSDTTAAVNRPSNPSEKGGVVTMTSIITDTGERKEMFGLQARHIKTVMTSEPSPDACQKDKMRIETDGWYVDLPDFTCPMNNPSVQSMRGMNSGGCQDKIRFKSSGSGKLGFALQVTTTMFGNDGKPQMTMTTETVDFSTAALDASLFDIPTGYSLASSSEELYKMDMNAMMRQAENSNNANNNENATPNTQSSNAPPAAKAPGTIRIGVLALANNSGQNVSVEDLRVNLMDNLTRGNVEAIPVSSAEDAKAKSCDFVLSANLSKLKQSTASKVGGMFGKVTGTDTSGTQKFETQVDYQLTGIDGQTTIQNKDSSKIDGNAETAAEKALSNVARNVFEYVSKKK